MNIGAQHCEGHFAEAREQQRLSILECLIEGGVNCLFDEAAGRLRPVAHGEKRGAAKRSIDVAQCHLRQVAGQRPPAAMPFF